MSRSLTFSVLIFLAITCTSINKLPTSATDLEKSDSYTIGFLTETTGSGAFYGSSSKIGALLALKDLQEQKLPISILFEETGNLPINGVSAVTKLIEVDKVDAVMSDLNAVSVAIAPRVNKAKIAFLHQSPAKSISTQFENARMNFIDYHEACHTIVKHWKNQGKRTGILAPHVEAGELCFKGAVSADSSIMAYRHNSGDDLRAAITKFASKKIEALLFIGLEPDFLSLIQHSKSQSYHPELGIGEIMLSKSLSAAAGSQLEGALVFAFDTLATEFKERLAAINPAINDYSPAPAAVAYNGVMTLANALMKCKKTALTCVQTELNKAPPTKLLGFKGWVDDHGPYPLILKRYRMGALGNHSM